MNSVVYCFDLDSKNELLKNGYTFIKKVEVCGKEAFMFANDGVIVNFDKSKMLITNKITF